MTGNIDIRKDRLRYTKNTTSSLLAYVAIIFNVLYFVSIYNKDVGNYYYTMTIGFSVICNLLFLLFTFLASEGVKNYKMGYCIGLIPLGIFQVVRIFGIPSSGHGTSLFLDGVHVQVMGDKQFYWLCACLICSALACFAGSAIGIYKTVTLRAYEKQINQ
jgi:hypothetical protein